MNALPPAGTRIAIYARCAARTRTANPVDNQVRVGRDHAARQGWDVVEVFKDEGRSGMSVAREGLWAMMEAARRGEFSVILVEDIDRFSRSAVQMNFIAEELRSLGIIICSVGPYAVYSRYSTEKQLGRAAIGE